MADYLETEARLHDALAYKRDHPKSSFRWLAKQFDVKKYRLNRRWNGKQRSRADCDPINLKLDGYQDKALCWYLKKLYEIGVPLRQKFIAAAANEILDASYRSTRSLPTVGEHWPTRWLQRHPKFLVQKEKAIEIERQRAMDMQQIQAFFEKYKVAVDQYKIAKEDIWNMDETGLRVGVGREQWVIVPAGEEKHKFSNLIGSFGDTEHVSVVEAISAGGTIIAPLIIIKGVVIQARWFADIQDGDTAIGISDSGYSNDILSFTWLQHFHRLSKRTQKGTYRLLILDGYDSHLSFQFVRYCELQKIIPLRLPPHSTHFLQPLDVVIFQQWKHWYAEAIDHAVRHGVGEFDRQTFLANIESIRTVTFTEGNIKFAFRKCGFWPFRPMGVLRQIGVDKSASGKERGSPERENGDSEAGKSSQEIWSSPNMHDKLYRQAEAIQQMLQSSVEPPDTPTRSQNRANAETFMRTVLASDVVHKQLTNYMWDSRAAQIQQECRKNSSWHKLQKMGIVYADDVKSRNITSLQELGAKWEADLSPDQKIYLLSLRTTVLPQILLLTKERRVEADLTATNCLCRQTGRTNRKRKAEELEHE